MFSMSSVKRSKLVSIFLSLLILLLLFGCSPKQSPPTNTPLQSITPQSTPSPSSSPAQTPTPTTSTPSPTQSPTQTLTIHFIDVGQGDSILIDLGQTEILIDGGEKSPGVVNYLSSYVDGALEVMVATHTTQTI